MDMEEGGSRMSIFWQMSKITEDEITKIQKHFSNVLILPEEELAMARGQWEKTSPFAWSLGWQIPVDMIARNIKSQCQIAENFESLSMGEGYYLF